MWLRLIPLSLLVTIAICDKAESADFLNETEIFGGKSVRRRSEPNNIDSEMDETDETDYDTTSPTPTERQFEESDKLEYLSHRVSYLETEFKRLREKFERSEGQLKSVQLHQRGCLHEGVEYREGQTFSGNENCTDCTCTRGKVYCRPVGCATVDCEHPVVPEGQCCPVCRESCIYGGKTYAHGIVHRPRSCVSCACDNGHMMCRYEQEVDCKPLHNCPAHKRLKPPNHCCPVCANTDFCTSHPCHTNATCINRKFSHECTCKPGFFGNGTHCYDVDECQSNGKTSAKDGCRVGTRCVNTPGSFYCECLPGYSRIDDRSCLDLLLF